MLGTEFTTTSKVTPRSLYFFERKVRKNISIYYLRSKIIVRATDSFNVFSSGSSMLADAPLDNAVKNLRKSIQLNVYKTVEETNSNLHEERKRRRKKHRNKQRTERPNRGRRKKRLGSSTLDEPSSLHCLIISQIVN